MSELTVQVCNADTAIAEIRHRISTMQAKGNTTTEDIREIVSQIERRNNLIVFGLSNEQDVNNIIQYLLAEYKMVGSYTTERVNPDRTHTPVRLRFTNTKDKYFVLKNSTKLKTSENFQNVFIKPDLTPQQRTREKECIQKKLKLQAANPSKIHVIKNYQVVEKM